jgi:hypothetical protein
MMLLDRRSTSPIISSNRCTNQGAVSNITRQLRLIQRANTHRVNWRKREPM